MNFDQFFTQFQSQESIAILFFLIIAFLLGLLTGRLSRRGRIRRLERELEARKKENADLNTELAGLREQLDLKDADLRKADFDLQERDDKISGLEAERARFDRQLADLQAELDKVRATNKTYTSTIEDLNDQIIGLKARNKELLSEIENETETTSDLAEIQSIYNATRNRLEALESKFSHLAGENQNLRSELNELKENRSEPVERSAPPITAAQPEEEENEEPLLDLSQDKKVIGEKIVIDGPERDELTRIKGVGPFLEKKLNEAGVFTYEQIGEWNDDRIAEITTLIGYLPGRIQRDEWVEQARRLRELKTDNPEAFRAAAATPADREDLQVIEGIGPKIEEILKDAGIRHWDDLAESDADHLRDILLTAGDHYRIHDPSTWPAQARLAANGNWELLKEYQEQLLGGREIEEE